MGARVVQRYIANEISDDRLRIYVVWEPLRDNDSQKAAEAVTGKLIDPRARHFWINDLAVSDSFKKSLGLAEQTAWDVYLVFPPGAEWGATPPPPAVFMHLDREELPADRSLNGIKLAEEIRQLLSPPPAVKEPPPGTQEEPGARPGGRRVAGGSAVRGVRGRRRSQSPLRGQAQSLQPRCGQPSPPALAQRHSPSRPRGQAIPRDAVPEAWRLLSVGTLTP